MENDIKYYMYKLVWLPDKESILENLHEEQTDNQTKEIIYKELNKCIEIEKWLRNYGILYNSWLDDISSEIYDVNNEINTNIIHAIKKANIELNKKGITLFYWFDVDRSACPDWKWINDPIDNQPLSTLDMSYPANNRKVCLKHFMIFPENA